MQEESGKMTAQEYLGQVEQKIIAVKNINSGINNLREILISIGGAAKESKRQEIMTSLEAYLPGLMKKKGL